MQLDVGSALFWSFVSATIGFGIAFLLERKLRKPEHKKSQRILIYVAMVSLGFGLMGLINELVAFPVQGLRIRPDKVASYLIANILVFPVIFLAIAKLAGRGTEERELTGNQRIRLNGPIKTSLAIILCLSIAYYGYNLLNGDISKSSYDLYGNIDPKNCNSPYEKEPFVSLQYAFKGETNEIFVKVEMRSDGKIDKDISKLDNCTVMNERNWSCGGQHSAGNRSPKHTFVDGVFSYDDGYVSGFSNCPSKVVKR